MCGLAGYASNDLNEDQRKKLTLALGAGIDSRGGHAAGYISINKHAIKYCKKLGRWLRAKQRFITTCAEGHMTLMHSRYATCGSKESIADAHPFAVKRNGQLKLWGAHNGVIHGAFENAKKHGRNITVDSQEIFELIADRNYEEIQSLTGYGVVTWLEANDHSHINLAKLSSGGDIVVHTLKEGGVVWASTSYILNEALKIAGLNTDKEYKGLETGRVYIITPEGMFESKIEGVKLGSLHSQKSTYNQGYWANNSRTEYDHTSRANTSGSTVSPTYGNHGLWCKCISCKEKEEREKKEKEKTTTSTSTSPHYNYVPPHDGEVVRLDGTKEWYFKGKLHSLNGPAVYKKDGTKEWWVNGECHRVDGPAVEKENGDKRWYFKNELHREGGPAIECANGDYQWYVHGKKHREDGPATYFSSKTTDVPAWEGYYLNDKLFTSKETYDAALVKWKQEQADKLVNQGKTDTKFDDIAKSKDHAFLRELKAFWDKNDEQEAKGDDDWGSNDSDKSRFLLRGVQG